MTTLLVVLLIFLLVTIPAATVSWTLWAEFPRQRTSWAANFHWLWFVLVVVLFILSRSV